MSIGSRGAWAGGALAVLMVGWALGRAEAQVSGAANSTTGSSCSAGNNADRSCQFSVGAVSAGPTTVASRYRWNISTDVGTLGNTSMSGTAQHNVSFNVTVNGGYRLDVTQQRIGEMRRVDDCGTICIGDNGGATVSGVTGSQTGGTVTSGSLNLADVADNPAKNTAIDINQNGAAAIHAVSNGTLKAHSLSFVQTGSTSSASDETALRMGAPSTVTGCTICGNRSPDNDGHFVNVTVVPLCGNGVVDAAVSEQCDEGGANGTAGSCCTANCTLRPNGASCRGAADVCDAPETCNGVSGACPADAYLPPATVCRASSPGEVCDEVEFCTGSGVACPADEVKVNGTLCRGAAGTCDVAETCDGVDKFCPSDDVVAGGTECRAVAGDCDVAESCDGIDPACPADAFVPSSVVCRAASGGEVCDIAETCTGSSADCPADAVEPASAVCRASSVGEVCDIEELCDGSSKVCPPDAVEPSSTVCRASSVGEVCDIAESCDGSSKLCPADAVEPATTQCRGSAGVCDVAETCDGSGKSCPSDAKSTAECRASSGACDMAESCDGSGNDCPADGFVSDGTNCEDSNFCNGTQTCTGGVCGGGTTPCGVGESCDEGSDICFLGECPVNPSSCRTAQKNKVLIKNKADNTKDKLVWKWTKGDGTTQPEFGDPLTTATYALCFYAGASPTLINSATIPPAGGKWAAIGTKGYKYKDTTGANDGITKVIVKGGAAGKSKALVKGKGMNLPDFDSDMPFTTDLPLLVQLRNNSSGVCWQGSFATPKKDLADQFNAKTP